MTTTLTGRDIGRANLATRAILDRHLDHAGLRFEQWMALFTLDGSSVHIDRDQLATTLARGLHIDVRGMAATIDAMVDARLLAIAGDAVVTIAAAGDVVFRPIKAAVDQLTTELYGDLPPDDLEATRRTLDEITRRAEVRLAALQ